MKETIDKPASVSAIVPARNEEEVIAACVESLAQQPEILEILVVDDQSNCELLIDYIVQPQYPDAS